MHTPPLTYHILRRRAQAHTCTHTYYTHTHTHTHTHTVAHDGADAHTRARMCPILIGASDDALFTIADHNRCHRHTPLKRRSMLDTYTFNSSHNRKRVQTVRT
jgi:hypothetical protein